MLGETRGWPATLTGSQVSDTWAQIRSGAHVHDPAAPRLCFLRGQSPAQPTGSTMRTVMARKTPPRSHVGQSRALRRGQLRDLSSSERPPRNVHGQEASFFFSLFGRKPQVTRELTESRPQQRSLHPSSSRQWQKPFAPDASCERMLRAREAFRGSRNRRSAYLEKRRRVWIGDDQRGDEDHAGEVARPLRGREDGDRATLREEGACGGRGHRRGSPRPRAPTLEQAPSNAGLTGPMISLLHMFPQGFPSTSVSRDVNKAPA